MHSRGGSGLERLQGCAGDLRVLRVVFGSASGAHFGVSEGHFGLIGAHFGFSEGHFGASESDFGHLESIRNTGVCFPRFVGVIFSVKLILATTDIVFVHVELILNLNSFAVFF